jgi:hypothetical protein
MFGGRDGRSGSAGYVDPPKSAMNIRSPITLIASDFLDHTSEPDIGPDRMTNRAAHKSLLHALGDLTAWLTQNV